MEHFKTAAKVIGYEDVLAADGETRLRVICSTAPDESVADDGDDITAFALSENQRTNYSIFIPKREGVDYDARIMGKTIQLEIYKETINELSNNTIETVKYETSDGSERTLYTLANCYICGTLTSGKAEFNKMQKRLKEGIENGEFVLEEEQPKPKQNKPKAKIDF